MENRNWTWSSLILVSLGLLRTDTKRNADGVLSTCTHDTQLLQL